MWCYGGGPKVGKVMSFALIVRDGQGAPKRKVLLVSCFSADQGSVSFTSPYAGSQVFLLPLILDV